MRVAAGLFLALGAFALLSTPVESNSAAAPVAPVVQGAGVAWSGPSSYVAGGSYEVQVTIEVGAEGAAFPSWRFGAGAFSIGGQPLGMRGEGSVGLPAGASLELSFDLGPALAAAGVDADFELACEGSLPRAVRLYRPAQSGLNFLDPSKIADAELADYKVLLSTSQGDILVELYPHLAPNHVRNFLDLSYIGFYNDVLFHRTIPGFMIQGGDPFTKDPTKAAQWGGGNGPRMLEAEFSQERHVRGILSAARLGHDVNSASCQFFIMHATYPTLDGQYSVFGKMVSGDAALDAIATTKTARGDRPLEEQKILSATVLHAPAKAE